MGEVFLAAALLFAAPAAQASPPVDAFIKACAATGADFTAAGAALSGPEWKPAEVTPPAMEGVAISQTLARVAVIGPTKVTAQAWHATKDQVQVNDCTFRLGATPFAAAEAEVRAWVGVAAKETGPAKAIYLFTNDQAGARRVVAQGEAKAAVAAGGLNILTVTANGLDTIIDLLKIKS